MSILPGEVYLAFDAAGKLRPIVIVSREELNHGDYVVAVLCTTAHFEARRKLPNCVPLHRQDSQLDKDCVVQCETVSAIAKEDIDVGKGVVATLEPEVMREIVRAIGYAISAECEPV